MIAKLEDSQNSKKPGQKEAQKEADNQPQNYKCWNVHENETGEKQKPINLNSFRIGICWGLIGVLWIFHAAQL